MYISLIKGDTGIGRRATLSDENGPVDVADANVVFRFSGHELTPIKEETGKLLLVFNDVHTAVVGVFDAVFKVKFADGRKETFPGAEQEGLKVYIKEWLI